MMEGIFFAQFDDIAGPVVVCEAPEEGVLGVDLFDRINDYIIARKELCGSHLTVWDDMTNKIVMSYPLFVENERLYRRNAFFFAFGFVFGDDVSTGTFISVLEKLSHVMKTMEIEKSFLSQAGAKDRLHGILNRVWYELAKWGECIVPIDEDSTLALKTTPRLLDPPEVFDYQVPVQVRDMDEFLTKEWDLTIQQVMRYVDGERHIKLIAEESGVAVALVRRSIRQLLYFRCVRLVDIFQFSNMYSCTPRLVEIAENEKMLKDCTNYIWNGVGDPPPLAKIFQLYASLSPCLELKDFCLLHDPDAHNVDVRRLITFGVLHGLIRRIHKYPVFLPEEAIDSYDEYCSSYYQGLNVDRFDDEEDEDQELKPTRSKSPVNHPDLTCTPGLEDGEEDNANNNIILKTNSNSNSLVDSITERDDETSGVHSVAPDPTTIREPQVEDLVNGRNCFDAICTEIWRSSYEIDSDLQRKSRGVAIIHK